MVIATFAKSSNRLQVVRRVGRVLPERREVLAPRRRECRDDAGRVALAVEVVEPKRVQARGDTVVLGGGWPSARLEERVVVVGATDVEARQVDDAVPAVLERSHLRRHVGGVQEVQ